MLIGELLDTQLTEPKISESESDSTSSESPSDLIAPTPGRPHSPRVKLLITKNIPPGLISFEEISDVEEEITLPSHQESLYLRFSEPIYHFIPFRLDPWYHQFTDFLHSSSYTHSLHRIPFYSLPKNSNMDSQSMSTESSMFSSLP